VFALEDGRTRSLYHPRHQLWSEHFAWSEDETQLEGRTTTGRTTVEVLHINRLQLVRLRGLWIKMDLFSPAEE
jgi:hypothetical protein